MTHAQAINRGEAWNRRGKHMSEQNKEKVGSRGVAAAAQNSKRGIEGKKREGEVANLRRGEGGGLQHKRRRLGEKKKPHQSSLQKKNN